MAWAGQPQYGTNNHGIFMNELEKRGCKFKLVALEAPHQLGKVERGGGVLKGMLQRVINATSMIGELEMQMALAECLERMAR